MAVQLFGMKTRNGMQLLTLTINIILAILFRKGNSKRERISRYFQQLLKYLCWNFYVTGSWNKGTLFIDFEKESQFSAGSEYYSKYSQFYKQNKNQKVKNVQIFLCGFLM